MREWKDSEIAKPKRYRLLLGSAIALFSFSLFNIIAGYPTINQYIDVGLSGFLIWGLKWNGIYKIARKIKEWEIKQKDNKWRNSYKH